jgi:hypothetical protein
MSGESCCFDDDPGPATTVFGPVVGAFVIIAMQQYLASVSASG